MISRNKTIRQELNKVEYSDRGIDTSRLFLAQVKYYDSEHCGVEVTGIDAYAFLYEINGVYVNPFNALEELPVYKRVPYSNTTRGGEDFGSKIIHKQGDSTSGPCYLMSATDASELFGKRKLKESDITSYIIRTSRFFVDRPAIMKGLDDKEFARYLDKIVSDQEKLAELKAYLDSHGEYQSSRNI